MSSTFYGGLAVTLFTALAAPAWAEGDVANGEKVFRKCAACHTVEADGPARVGPNLHDVVGRVTGSFEGYAYSEVMTTMGAEGHVWTPEELDKYLENPRQFAPGTKMAFVGLRKPEERADVIAYLISLNPAGAEAAEPAAPEAEAEPAN